MSKHQRKRVDAEVKIKSLQRHAIEKVPVSQICEDLGIQPSVFYNWQRELYARGATVFDTKLGRPKVDRSGERIAALEAKLARKDAVMAELLQEHVELKKVLARAEWEVDTT